MDEEATGFCPRLDLRKKIESYVAQDPHAQKLVDRIRGIDAMIVEEDEFFELVDEWAASRP